MGEVYRARDTRLGREVAIKVLPADRVADADRRRRFVQEAQAASALNHPHIITIYEIESADGNDFIVMEYVRGKSLDALIPRQGMRINEALRIAIAVADALVTAHARGIVHRDLKPANRAIKRGKRCGRCLGVVCWLRHPQHWRQVAWLSSPLEQFVPSGHLCVGGILDLDPVRAGPVRVIATVCRLGHDALEIVCARHL
jgi:serine/threonine protein kinase